MGARAAASARVRVPRGSVYGDTCGIPCVPVDVPAGVRVNAPNTMDGLRLLGALAPDAVAAAFLDPQYRGVLDHQNYGNEGVARASARAGLPQMTEDAIARFVAGIGRVLVPGGHLFLWVDKFHLCKGVGPWLEGTPLGIVDMVVWDKRRTGMGYRTRRVSEQLVVIQKAPRRAKGVWKAHDIPDVWPERQERSGHPHRKPTGLQARLIEAVTNPGATVVDPAAGGYSVLESCRRTGRDFVGCDLLSAPDPGSPDPGG